MLAAHRWSEGENGGDQWTCSTTREYGFIRFPTGGGTLVRFGLLE
ncbi:hypothetical protein DES53_11742 [Roseimicrobium gellanilyticum]|uniref:Uncharacterized protein n=1 Tax=Roseimicrobium gellanilyticum TaxID=748857 RepID=A0A366H3C2_9BACT|nr:hypothetical protein DES53_11742 [Roseimicrobium gellanilyticum]